MNQLDYVAERSAAARRADLLAEAETARQVNKAIAGRLSPVLARAAARWGGPVRVLRGGASAPSPAAA